MGFFQFLDRVLVDKMGIVLLSKEVGAYTIRKRFNLPITATDFIYNEGKYLIDLDKCVKDSKNKPFIFYEIGNFNPISFIRPNKEHEAKTLNNYLDNNDLEQLNTKRIQKMYLIIIIVMAVGLVIVGGWGIWNMSESNKRITELGLQILNMTKTNGSGGIIVP